MMKKRQISFLMFLILFLEAFQFSDTNGSNGIDETDMVFLKGILDNPAVTQRFKVSKKETVVILLLLLFYCERKPNLHLWMFQIELF